MVTSTSSTAPAWSATSGGSPGNRPLRSYTRLSFFTENVGTINDISGKARLFLVLHDAFLGAFLILWIFTSLPRTLEKLQARRSSVKLDIYRMFTNVLAISVIASVAWIGYEVFPA